MAATLRFLLLGVGLPAVGGVAAGILLTGSKPGSATAQAAPAAQIAESPLPDDPETLKLAALAGRTKEARAKVKALLDAGAPDKDIAAWLAPLLVADPEWLETFILTVPEDRRIAVVRVTFLEIANLHPDSVWELLKRSPFAAMAARKDGGTPEYKGLDLFWCFPASDQTADVLFDPGLGLTDEELADYFRIVASSPANAKRILDEWATGRWAGSEPPNCVRGAWSSLRSKDPDFLAELEKKAPAALQPYLANFQARAGFKEKLAEGRILSDPTAGELEKIGAAGVKDMVERRGWAARPIPLSTLAQLSPEVRGPAIDNYFDQLYPFSEKAAAEAIAMLDDLDLTPAERQSLLKSAANVECNDRGDYAAALELAVRMPDAAAREKFEREAWEEWATQDPDGALAHSATLPDGELKRRVEALANESKP